MNEKSLHTAASLAADPSQSSAHERILKALCAIPSCKMRILTASKSRVLSVDLKFITLRVFAWLYDPPLTVTRESWLTGWFSMQASIPIFYLISFRCTVQIQT